MKEITKESIIERSSDMMASSIDDEVVLLSVSKSKYYGMDEIGASIWNMIDREVKVYEIIERVYNEYDMPKEEIERDIIEYLQELNKNNIIVIK